MEISEIIRHAKERRNVKREREKRLNIKKEKNTHNSLETNIAKNNDPIVSLQLVHFTKRTERN